MTIALIFVVSCARVDNTICKDMLGACLSKCCQHAIDDSKVYISLTFLSIKKNMIYFA